MAMPFSAPSVLSTPSEELPTEHRVEPEAQHAEFPLRRQSWSGQGSGARTTRARRVSKARKSSRLCSIAS